MIKILCSLLAFSLWFFIRNFVIVYQDKVKKKENDNFMQSLILHTSDKNNRNLEIGRKIITSAIVGRQIGEARMQSETTNALPQ